MGTSSDSSSQHAGTDRLIACAHQISLETFHTQAFLSVSTLLAAASASPQLLGGVGHGVGIGHGVGVGHAVVGHAVAHAVPVYPDEVSPYTYQYAVADDYSGARFDAQESDDGTAARQGHYSVSLPDGRIQH